MTWSGLFWGIGDFLDKTFTVLHSDVIGNKFNYSLIVLGFFGLFFWLNKQRKMSEKAKNDPNQLK